MPHTLTAPIKIPFTYQQFCNLQNMNLKYKRICPIYKQFFGGEQVKIIIGEGGYSFFAINAKYCFTSSNFFMSSWQISS